jgi:asparagine synthase (glutamine-hydrolysing)
MASRLGHRGPDAEGFFVDEAAALGHRRLSIIDLSELATQPQKNEDGSVIAAVNGEFYNFAPIRQRLIDNGHHFRSRSDSEVALHLYEERGEAFLDELRGMFAIALWDARKKKLLLARDRLGKKPLYWTLQKEQLWFASELEALWSALPEKPRPDLGAIDRYLGLHYIPSPQTAFAGIHKLPAGHFLTFADGKTRLQRYWKPRYGARGEKVNEDDAIEEVRALLDESVKLRMVGDVPHGAFLSGGVDSSTVVALLSRHSAQAVKTFSIDFPTGGEAPFARVVARRWKTDHQELVVTPDMVSIVPELVRRYGEPFGDSSAVPVYYLSQMTRRHVTIALSGDGADEVFGGYHRYRFDAWARRLSRVPLVGRAAQWVPSAALNPVRQFARHLASPDAERYLFLFHFMESDRESLLGPALKGRSDEDPAVVDFERRLAESTTDDPINQLLELDLHTYLADDILPKVDIASMAHALEVRAPFLDHVLVEAVARLPGSLKVRGFEGKRLLRKIVRDLVPRENLSRLKKGFGLPLAKWMREDLAPMSRDLLTDQKARQRGLTEPRTVERLLDEHQRGIDHSQRLWNLLMLELWYRHFIDQQQASGSPQARRSDSARSARLADR